MIAATVVGVFVVVMMVLVVLMVMLGGRHRRILFRRGANDGTVGVTTIWTTAIFDMLQFDYGFQR